MKAIQHRRSPVAPLRVIRPRQGVEEHSCTAKVSREAVTAYCTDSLGGLSMPSGADLHVCVLLLGQRVNGFCSLSMHASIYVSVTLRHNLTDV